MNSRVAETVQEPSLPNSFSIFPVSDNYVLKVIFDLKNKHTTGYDEISSIMIKSCAFLINRVLAHIFNTSFVQGTYPTLMKIACINPIFKKGNREQVENYRPISLLPTISKMFRETHV